MGGHLQPASTFWTISPGNSSISLNKKSPTRKTQTATHKDRGQTRRCRFAGAPCVAEHSFVPFTNCNTQGPEQTTQHSPFKGRQALLGGPSWGCLAPYGFACACTPSSSQSPKICGNNHSSCLAIM